MTNKRTYIVLAACAACFSLSTRADVRAEEAEPLAKGPLAVVEPLEWETDLLAAGARIFLDVGHALNEAPDALRGKTFIRSNFSNTRKVCVEPGLVYAITPAAGQALMRENQWELGAELFREVKKVVCDDVERSIGGQVKLASRPFF
jgi:hypothetical protein